MTSAANIIRSDDSASGRPSESAAPAAARRRRTTYCMAPCGGCHQRCALKVYIENERVVKVEPADFFRDDPRMRGGCLLAYASVRWNYNPDRIKYPLRRIGERGSGQWERVSWDEALDYTASRLREIRDKYGSTALMVGFGGSSTIGNLGGKLAATRFANVWGAGADRPPGHTTDGGVPTGLRYIFGDSQISTDSLAFHESKLVIQWGGNIAEAATREMRHVVEAKESGTRFIVVGVIYDPTAAKADQFIGVRMATDAAFALSMINTIIGENLYDRAYVQSYTVGPFLVRLDNKKFLREADVVAGGSTESYMIWDSVTQSARPVAAGTQAIAGTDPALLGSFTIQGIACKPSFQLLAERAAEYPPDVGAQITNVPARTIVEFAREYATTKPACIYLQAGLVRHYHGNIGARAIGTLAALTGNVGVRGGGPGGSRPVDGVRLNTRQIQWPKGAPGVEKVPGVRSEGQLWTKIRSGEYRVKAFIGGYRNFMQAYGNAWGYKEIFSKFEFICQIGLFLDITTSYADIVLPDASPFERADIYADPYNLGVYLTEPVAPYYESKPNHEIFAELAKRVGLGEYFAKSTEEWLQEMIEGDNPTLEGITWEKLKRDGYVRANVSYEMEVCYADKKFPTPSGRIEFYQEPLIPYGEELPLHKEHLESPRSSPQAARYPLTYMTKRKRHFMQTSYSNVDWMREIAGEPMVDINPADAAPRGVKDGDVVRAFNDRGEVVCKARLNQAVPPGLVNIDHGWWPEDFIRGHYNYPTWAVDDPHTLNPALLTDYVFQDPDRAACNHTMIFDVLVEVEKLEAQEVRNGRS